MSMPLHLVGDPVADELLTDNPFALLVGMLLDQQIPMEVAFNGPRKLMDRLGGVEPVQIAALDLAEFVAVCATPPSVHRFPTSMGQRIHELASAITTVYGGATERIWTDEGSLGGPPTGPEVLSRLKALPGFGDQKARIFLALLGKQRGVEPEGWREAAGAYGAEGATMSIADVVDAESLTKVRAYKREQKAAAKAAREQ